MLNITGFRYIVRILFDGYFFIKIQMILLNSAKLLCTQKTNEIYTAEMLSHIIIQTNTYNTKMVCIFIST